MAKKIGVILSGCGVFDGSEIHEAVCTLLSLDRAGAEAICLAPDREQAGVVNHLTNEAGEGKRNVLVESARIARGKIGDVSGVKASELDAVILPGGFGAAKNLCTFAVDGPLATVDSGVASFLKEMHAAGKPIAALCIAPAVLALVLGKEARPELTIGLDEGTAKAIEATGAKHANASATDIVVDKKNKIVTTPCYMLATRISEVAEGADKAVRALLEMA